MPKLKIVFLMEMSNNRGGMVQSVVSLIEGLSKYRDLDIITISPKDSELSKIVFGSNVTHLTTKTEAWTCSKSNVSGFLKTCSGVRRIIKRIGNNALYVTNNYGASIILSCCFIKNITEIFVCRGGKFRGRGMGGWFMRNKIRFGRIHHIVNTSRQQQDLVVKHGQPLSKTSIIHNGLPMPPENYNPVILDKNCVKIATLGYISEGKNQEVGVLLTKLLRQAGVNATYHIYGKADCASDLAYKSRLDKIISDNKMQDYVFYEGFVTGEKPFESSDIILSTSLSEGFGRTIVEGMLRKRCVMAWRGAGGPVDITDNGRYSFLVDENKPETYANIIISMIENPELLHQNISEAYTHAKYKFSESTMSRNYHELFLSLIR